MPNPSSKRPGILAWGLFALAGVVGVWVIINLVASFVPALQRAEGTAGKRAASASGVTSRSLAFEADISAPSAAPPMALGAPASGGAESTGGAAKQPEQRIIKAGELELRVVDAAKASDKAKTLVTGKNGYVESSSMSDTGEGPRTAEMIVRVPVNAFEQTMGDLKKLAVVVLNEDVAGQDITEEFVDLESDLKNAKAEETSYLEIMKRAGKIEDVLAVAERLADVRGRIQRFEGRKRFLENKTDLATIKLTLTEETRVSIPTKTWKPLEILRQSANELVQTLQAFVDFLIRFLVGLVSILPFLAFTAVIIWLGWKLVKWFIGRMR